MKLILPNTTPDLLLATTAKPAAPSAGRRHPPAQVSRSKALEPHKQVGTVLISSAASAPPGRGEAAPVAGRKDEPAPELRAPLFFATNLVSEELYQQK